MTGELSNPIHPLEIYFRHNLWSNLLLLDACLELDETQLNVSAAGTFGSIRETVGHIVFAEEWYIFRITSGEQPAGARPAADTPLTELRARAAASGETLRQLATSLEGRQRVRLKTDKGVIMMPVEALLLQAIHHAHEHRTHIETVMGQLQLDPPELSGWRYFEDEMQ